MEPMYERLAEKLKTTSKIRWFPGHGAEESWIEEAEQELGFRLPPSYRWWATHYGDGWLNGGHILSIGDPEHREYTDSDLLYIHRLNKAEDWWVSRFPNRLDLFVPDSDEQFFSIRRLGMDRANLRSCVTILSITRYSRALRPLRSF